MQSGVNADNIGVKFTGFDDTAGYSKKDEDPVKKKFDNYPGGVFTMPNNHVAYNNSVSDEEAGGFNA